MTWTSSPTILLVQKDPTNPISKPIIGPRIEFYAKLVITGNTPAPVPLERLTKKRKNTIAVPSFNNASASIRVLNLRLAPSSFRRATTATGSVAERTAPKVKA